MAPQLLRCKEFAVKYYSFTLYALDLQHLDFCNVKVNRLRFKKTLGHILVQTVELLHWTPIIFVKPAF
jgi:hypothetical protein